MKVIVFLAGFLLAAQTDWVLEAPGQESVCAKDQAVCEAARGELAAGRLFRDLPRTGWRCAPRPDCFPPSGDCIAGYNCR